MPLVDDGFITGNDGLAGAVDAPVGAAGAPPMPPIAAVMPANIDAIAGPAAPVGAGLGSLARSAKVTPLETPGVTKLGNLGP